MTSESSYVITNIHGDEIHPGDQVSLLSIDNTVIGTAEVFKTPDGNFGSTLHCTELADLQSKYALGRQKFIVIKLLSTKPSEASLKMPYPQPGEEAPEKLGDMFPKQNYIWDLNKLRLLNGPPPSPTPTPVPVQQIPDSDSSAPLLDFEPPLKRAALDPNIALQSVQPAFIPVPSPNQLLPSNDVIMVHSDDDDEEGDLADLYDEGEVPPQSIEPSSSSMNFDVQNYKKTRIRISLSNMNVPDHSARDVDPVHARALAKDFDANGYLSSQGEISVIYFSQDHTTPPFSGSIVKAPVFVVDGLHRRWAFNHLQSHSVSWKEFCEELPATIWTRVDGLGITSFELLAISNFLNHTAQQFRALTFRDAMYTVVSAATLYSTNASIPKEEVTSTSLANCLNSTKVLANIGYRQLQKYAQVGMQLIRSDSNFDAFMKSWKSCPRLALSHLTTNALANMDDECYKLSLQCLCIRIAGKASGDFATFRLHFFQCMKILYSVLQEVSEKLDLTVPMLLDKPINVTNTEQKTVRETIMSQMLFYKKYQNFDSANQQKKKTLLGRLTNSFGDLFKATNEDIDEIQPQQPQPQPSTTPSVIQPEEGRVTRQSERLKTPTPAQPSIQRIDDNFQPKHSEPTKKKPKKKTKAKKKKTLQDLDESSDENVEEVPIKENITGKDEQDLVEVLEKMDREDLKSLLNKIHADVVFRSQPTQPDQPGGVSNRQNTVVRTTSPKKFADASESFKDSIPSAIPYGYQPPTDYIGNPVPTWLHFLRIIPSRWPEQNPIGHVQPWLHSTHLPKQHRANIVLDINDLRWAHHQTFWRATSNYIKENGMKVNPVSEALSSFSNKNLMWTTSFENDQQAQEYFWQKKEELDIQGFCILQDFLNDHDLPDDLDNSVLKSVSKNFLIDLRKYTLNTFPSLDVIKNRSSRKLWDIIINVGTKEDTERSQKGEGRFTSTHAAMTGEMEKKNTVWACKARALLDVRIATAMSALRVHDNHKINQPRLFTPKTGGRWLYTSKGCQRQQVHSDFPTLSAQQLLARKCPGYFTISTGEHPVPLWVSPESHRRIAVEDSSDPFPVNLIHIPPFSIFIGRGDVLHAGASYEDSPRSDTYLRYHLYFVPSYFSLPDGVFLAHGMNLNFRKEPQGNVEANKVPIEQSEEPDHGTDENEDGNVDESMNEDDCADGHGGTDEDTEEDNGKESKSQTKSGTTATPEQPTGTTSQHEQEEEQDETESNTPSSRQTGKRPVERQPNVLERIEKEMEELGISPPSPSI